MDDPRKWLRVRNDLLRQLDAGVLEPGDEVIGEYEAEDHGVGQMSAYNAMQSLVREGRLERRGRKYVVPDRVIDNPGPLRPAERGGKWASIASSLRDRITSGEIKPGTLLQIWRLTDEYRVSQTTMRHALRVLGREGIVKAYAGHGHLVTGRNDDQG